MGGFDTGGFLTGLLGGFNKGMTDKAVRDTEAKLREHQENRKLIDSILDNPNIDPNTKRTMIQKITVMNLPPPGKGKGGKGGNPIVEAIRGIATRYKAGVEGPELPKLRQQTGQEEEALQEFGNLPLYGGGASQESTAAQGAPSGPQVAERASLPPMPARGAGAPGIIQAGNIDLSRRPKVRNADGTISTVRSMSFEEDGKEILVPTVSDDGRILSNQEAIAEYHRTGKHLGIFDTAEHATAYAQRLHQQQAQSLTPGAGIYDPGMSSPEARRGGISANEIPPIVETPTGTGWKRVKPELPPLPTSPRFQAQAQGEGRPGMFRRPEDIGTEEGNVSAAKARAMLSAAGWTPNMPGYQEAMLRAMGVSGQLLPTRPQWTVKTGPDMLPAEFTGPDGQSIPGMVNGKPNPALPPEQQAIVRNYLDLHKRVRKEREEDEAARAAAADLRAQNADERRQNAANNAVIRKRVDSVTDINERVAKMQQAYKAAENADSAAADVTLLFNFISVAMAQKGFRLTMPEIRTAISARGVGGGLEAFYENAVNGQKLSSQQRRDFLNQATSAQEAAMLGLKAEADDLGVDLNKVAPGLARRLSGTTSTAPKTAPLPPKIVDFDSLPN